MSLTAEEQAALPFGFLEVAPVSGQAERPWSTTNVNVTGATGLAVGTGAANTDAIVAAHPADDNAAAYALGYSNNELDDWFQPSLDELAPVIIREEFDGTAMGSFEPYTWSSPSPTRRIPPATGSTTATVPSTTTTTAAVATAQPLTEEQAETFAEQSLGAPSVVTPGQSVTVEGSGFTPGAGVDLYVASTPVLLASTTASETGTLSFTVALPSELTGNHHLVVYESATGIGFRQAIQIQAAELAFTGPAVGGAIDAQPALIRRHVMQRSTDSRYGQAVNHPLLEAVAPLIDAIGCEIVSEEESVEGDVPLEWDGSIVAIVRLPDLNGALARQVALVEAELGESLSSLSYDGKHRAVRLLEERGAFTVRKGVEQVADALGVSRFTIYNYLNATRSNDDGPDGSEDV